VNCAQLYWNDARESLPSMFDADLRRSALVLASDGLTFHVAYVHFGWDREDKPRWKIHGRDSYDFDGVTAWSFLPSLPNLAAPAARAPEAKP